jgi:hypothetical protein
VSRLDPDRDGSGVLPEGVDPLGVPHPRSGHNAFVVTAAMIVALLALIFTLSWIVYHQLTPAPADEIPTRAHPTGQTLPLPSDPT